MAKAEGRRAGVEVLPPVERVRDSDGCILRAIAVRVAYERRLPVVVEFAVGDRDLGAAVRDIEETVVAIHRSR